MKKIGIEEGLTNVADFLTDEGYSVKQLSGSMDENLSSLKNFDAIVVSGLNTNMFGYDNVKANASIIDADGLTPQEVRNMIERQIDT
ncbi:MAG: YkuS family protein [Candidatus Alkaliphilus sp. MAG34]|nr:YkuS family protein [Clostridiales bacterium]